MARTSTSLSSGAPSSIANHKVLASLPFFETYIEPIFKLLNISLVQVCSSRFCLQPRVRGKFKRCVSPSLLRSRFRHEVNNLQSSSTKWIPLYLLFAQLLTLRLNMIVLSYQINLHLLSFAEPSVALSFSLPLPLSWAPPSLKR